MSKRTGYGFSWGQLNQGQRYNILALDLDRAIALAGFGVYESILLEQVREESWHGSVKSKRVGKAWPDPRPAALNIDDLAREIGVDRRRLYEARASLLAARVLVLDSGGAFWINKQADQWLDPRKGQPRLRPQWVEFCRKSRPQVQFDLPLEDEGPETPQTVPTQQPEDILASAENRTSDSLSVVRKTALFSAENRTKPVRKTALFSAENRTKPDAPPGPPIEDRAPQEDLIQTNTEFFLEGEQKNGASLNGGKNDDDDTIDWMAEATSGHTNGRHP